MRYNSQAAYDTRTELGFWFDTNALAMPLTASGLTLYSRLAWAHDFQTDGQSSAFFQSLPDAAFIINTTKPADNGGLVTVGFDYKLANGWSLEAPVPAKIDVVWENSPSKRAQIPNSWASPGLETAPRHKA